MCMNIQIWTCGHKLAQHCVKPCTSRGHHYTQALYPWIYALWSGDQQTWMADCKVQAQEWKRLQPPWHCHVAMSCSMNAAIYGWWSVSFVLGVDNCVVMFSLGFQGIHGKGQWWLDQDPCWGLALVSVWQHQSDRSRCMGQGPLQGISPHSGSCNFWGILLLSPCL